MWLIKHPIVKLPGERHTPAGVIRSLADRVALRQGALTMLIGMVPLLLVSVSAKAEEENLPPAALEVLSLLTDHLRYQRQAELELRQMRLEIIRQAIELEKQRREEAKTERKHLELQIKALELKIKQKEWALQNFEPGERLIPSSNNLPKQMREWKASRERWKDKFINSPHASRGDIASGRALNFFLDACGPTALAHLIYLEEVSDSISKSALIERHVSAGESTEGLRLRESLIREVSGRPIFSEADLKDVNVQKGLIGQKLKIRLNDDALPLEWPYILGASEPLRPFRDALEKDRQKALDELRKGQGLPYELQGTLMSDTDRLCQAFDVERKNFFSTLRKLIQAKSPEAKIQASLAPQWSAADRFLKDLRGSVARLISARSIDDVEARIATSESGNVSIAEILAFMSRHALRFTKADPHGEDVYLRLFHEMKRYYVDLVAMDLLLKAEQRKVQITQRKADRLLEIQLDRFTIPQHHEIWHFSSGFYSPFSLAIP